MAWYHLLLGKNGVEHLNQAFEDGMYIVDSAVSHLGSRVALRDGEQIIPILQYRLDYVLVFHEMIRHLSAEQQQDIKERLRKGGFLESIVRKIEEDLQAKAGSHEL